MPEYRNGLAIVETTLNPEAVMQALRDIEAEFGRLRAADNAPRTLDLDLVAYGRTVLEAEPLRLPHPRAAERLFVMGPLAEIAPGWVHPTLGETAADLAAKATVGADARPV
jgi:2-amino-4-hydroxy-6-hydroxymethyldihydropteridine diphosphokinase